MTHKSILAIAALAASVSVGSGSAAAEPAHSSTMALEVGPGGVTGLSTTSEYDRSNPGIFGTFVWEQSISESAWRYGAEVHLGSELSGEDERGGFGYLMGGLRMSRRTGDSFGVWSAVRFGAAGHTSGQFTTGFGAGFDFFAFGRVGFGATADVFLLSPGYDSLLDEDLDAAVVGTVTVRAIWRFSQ